MTSPLERRLTSDARHFRSAAPPGLAGAIRARVRSDVRPRHPWQIPGALVGLAAAAAVIALVTSRGTGSAVGSSPTTDPPVAGAVHRVFEWSVESVSADPLLGPSERVLMQEIESLSQDATRAARFVLGVFPERLRKSLPETLLALDVSR